MRKTLLSYLLITLIVLPAQSQVVKPDPPPRGIKLLPGYQHKTGRGIDTLVGTIWKEGGISITYDIGPFAGMHASPDQKDRYVWYKEQIINNQTARIAFTKERALKVTFVEAHGSFVALVPKEEDLADALLIILSFGSR